MFGLTERLERIERGLTSIFHKMSTLSQQVQDLQAAVANETAVDQSAITLLQKLAQMINDAANSGDLAAVQQLATEISANTNALAAAVQANTPAQTAVS